MGLAITPINRDGVLMKVQKDTIYISGSIDNQNPESYMTPFLSELHENIIENGIKEMKVDIRKLDFLNSSGIKELVVWVMKINEEDENKKYRINFICNDNLNWQRSSISTLEYLNANIVKIV